jgi:adenylate cyclase
LIIATIPRNRCHPRGAHLPGGTANRVVRDQVRDKLAFVFDDRGEQQVKNIARAIRSYFVQLSDRRPASVAAAPDTAQLPLPGRALFLF